MSKPKVYLAGPIARLTYAGATAWRRAAAVGLAPAECLDPMRDKESLAGSGDPLGVQYLGRSPLLDAQTIVSRDYHDVRRSDVVLMHLPFPSTGTLVELGWAVAMQKPVVLWLPEDVPSALRLHPFVQCLPWSTVRTIHEAVAVVRSFLNLPPRP